MEDVTVPLPKNFLASPFKELHSHLQHLTWQAKQVAKGDYSQRVDFMGDFSEAFNFMITSLDNNEKALKRKIGQLEEALSHIVGEDLLSRLFGMLKEDGVLIISDNNNWLCRAYRKHIAEFWDRVENGPPGKCGKRKVEFVYKDLRRKLITEWFGDKLNAPDIDALTENTAYLYGVTLREACQQFLSSRELPRHRYKYGTTPINPEHGYFIEKAFDL